MTEDAGAAVGEEREGSGFVEWVEVLADELHGAAVGTGLGEVVGPEGYEGARDFLLSSNGLGGEDGFGGVLPGFYLHGRYHGQERKAGEDLLYWVWRAAWAQTGSELDEEGTDCKLRIISISFAHRDEGEVFGLDLRGRECRPSGTVLFHERVPLVELVCSSEADLKDLYSWACKS